MRRPANVQLPASMAGKSSARMVWTLWASPSILPRNIGAHMAKRQRIEPLLVRTDIKMTADNRPVFARNDPLWSYAMTTDFRYEPNWDSLQNYEVPEWFMNDKLGIFIHWGPYSVPAFNNEWYPRFMYRDEVSRKGSNYFQHHTQTWGHPSKFGYKDFIPLFKAENWDPAQWIDLFQKAGARYIVPVAEHHDGFPMYASTHTRWNAALMGPKRDVCKELERETRAAGLKFGVSSHRAFNWRYYSYADDFDTTDPGLEELYNPPPSGRRARQLELLCRTGTRARLR